jgi:hypothetical protein
MPGHFLTFNLRTPCGVLATICILKMKDRLLAVVLTIAAAWGTTAPAQTYSPPPSWMPMTMLNVSFDTTNQTLAVVSEASLLGAGVYPVLTMATNGSYDPAKPWAVLNGTAYSRRLGWDDPNRKNANVSQRITNLVQSVYGANARIWIECLNRSAGLEAYLAIGKFGVNADNTTNVDVSLGAYSGIFGTAGSSNRWQWDGNMDHNTYAVALTNLVSSNQVFTASYKIYIGDSTGSELSAASGASTTTTWTWQGPAWAYAPALGIQSAVVLSWTPTRGTVELQSAGSLSNPTWATVTNTPVSLDGKTAVILDASAAQKFFRLIPAQ